MDWLTADLVQPIVDAIGDGAGVLVPIGVGIMAVMVGISMIPRIVYKFF